MFYNDELSVGKADLMLFSDHVYWKQHTNQLNVFSTLVLSGLCTSVLILKDFFFFPFQFFISRSLAKLTKITGILGNA